MQQGLRDLPAHTPLELGQARDHRPGQSVQCAQASTGAVLLEVDLRGVPGGGPAHDPFPPVPVPEGGTETEVVTPRLELAHGDVTGGQQPGTLTLITRGTGAQRRALQPAVDQVAHMLVEQHGPEARAFRAAGGPAGVGHEAFRVARSFEDAAAERAPGDPREQAVLVVAGAVTDPRAGVRAVPQATIDQHGPGVLDAEPVRTCEHAEGRFGTHDPQDRGGRPPVPAARRGYPVTGQPVSDQTPPIPRRALPHDPLQHRTGVRVDLGLALGGLPVAVGDTSGEPAGARGPVLRCDQVLTGLVTLPRSHDEQQADHRLAHRGRRVDRLVNTDHPGAPSVQGLDGRQATDQRPGEPVQARDDDPGAVPGLHPGDGSVHAGPVHRPAGPVEVLVPFSDLHAVRDRPRRDRFALLPGGLEAVPRPAADVADPDVAVHDVAHPANLPFDVNSPRHVEVPHTFSGGLVPYSDQRAVALARANAVRHDHTELKRDLHDQRVTVTEALDDPRVHSLTLFAVLTAQPRWGRTRALEVLHRHRISEVRRVRDLTDRQRMVLAVDLEPALVAA